MQLAEKIMLAALVSLVLTGVAGYFIVIAALLRIAFG